MTWVHFIHCGEKRYSSVAPYKISPTSMLHQKRSLQYLEDGVVAGAQVGDGGHHAHPVVAVLPELDRADAEALHLRRNRKEVNKTIGSS
jgi:hypothetical protein